MTSMDEEFEVLLNRLADGLATESDERHLVELMRSSPEARRAYREFMALHSTLHWDYVAAVLPAPPESSAAKSVPVLPIGWLVPAVVSAVVTSAVALFVLWLTVPPAGPQSVVSDALPPDAIVALLVDEVGAEFAQGRAPDGVRFAPGDYELLKGIVHLRFAHGADVVLASPARFDVINAHLTRLAHGKVRVTAPPTAKGFTIATREVDYVDLGTEFGLRVDSRSGASDLYVFDGQVNVADPRSGKVLSEVVQGESSRSINGIIGAAPKLQEDEFPTPGAIGYQRWQQYEAELRQDRMLLAFYPFRRTSDEAVLANRLSDDAMADGRIVGARWTTGRWPGKEALLFDRDTDFVQIDIPGEFEELTIAAWLKVDRLDYVFNAILNSDGYEPGGIHFQLTRQGFPRGGVIVNGNFNDNVLGNSVPVGSWAHVASVLSTRTRSQQIYVNGALARERHWLSDEVLHPGSCRLGNWLSDPKDSFTNRALRGRIDELAIWNRALPADEVRNLVEAGRPGLLWSAE